MQHSRAPVICSGFIALRRYWIYVIYVNVCVYIYIYTHTHTHTHTHVCVCVAGTVVPFLDPNIFVLAGFSVCRSVRVFDSLLFLQAFPYFSGTGKKKSCFIRNNIKILLELPEEKIIDQQLTLECTGKLWC